MPHLSKWLLAAGSIIILYTFLYDYGNLLMTNNLLFDYVNLLHNQTFVTIAKSYIPKNYNWTIFWIGESLICVAIVQLYLISKLHELHAEC
jgi:hypothetical protein